MPIMTDTLSGVSVTSTGLSYLIKSGTTVSGPHTAIVFDASANSLFNRGTIFGESTAGVDVSYNVDDTYIFNGEEGLIAGQAFGVRNWGLNTQIINNGTINAEAIGVDLAQSEAENDVSSAVLHNGGSITAATGVRLASVSAAQTVVNTGDIHGVSDAEGAAWGVGVYVVASNAHFSVIQNSGTIGGSHYAVRAHPDWGKVLLKNSGELNGAVSLGGAADAVRNSGAIIGDLELGGGSDTYRAKFSDGFVFGTVFGGDGSDLLVGGRADEDLNGGSGNDGLFGNNGEDRLTGGSAADRLFGGSGADTFVFAAATDSTVALSSRDTIFDFDSSLDVLDVSSLDAKVATAGNDAFTFIGTGAFSNAAGQLRYSVNTAGHAVISGDTNGDGQADFAITVLNTSGLNAGDFLL